MIAQTHRYIDFFNTLLRILLPGSLMSKRVLMFLLLPMVLTACAQLSIHPQAVQPPDAAVAARAIEEESVAPITIMVRDFDFSPSSIRDNGSPLHRLINLFRHD